jgi:hypothetical protein
MPFSVVQPLLITDSTAELPVRDEGKRSVAGLSSPWLALAREKRVLSFGFEEGNSELI